MQKLYTPQTLAQYLGLSINTVRTYTQHRRWDRIPRPVRMGKFSRWRPADVEAWLEARIDGEGE